MNKKNVIYLASTLLIGTSMLMACGNKKQGDSLKEEASKEVFTPGEKATAVDTLKEIDEMVAAVESPVAGINGTPYNAAFFQNEANKADKASADKYAQTESGLKYVIAKEGTGKSPKSTDTVTVHYVGTLTDGTQFDSSIDRGEPIDFPLNAVIPGWTEGLQLMKEGAKYVFFIPSDLAYGAQGAGRDIPPHSTLIFEVELIKVG